MLPALDNIGGSEQLKLVRELGTIRRNMSDVDGINKLTLIKRIREIRVKLSLSGNSSPDELVIDTSDMGNSYEVLANYLNESVGRLPESLIGVEVATVRKIEPFFFKRSKADHPSRDVYVAAVSDKTRRYHPDEVGVFEHYKSLSNIPAYDIGEIKSILESIERVSSETPEDSPDVVSQMEEVRSSLSIVMDTLNSLRNVNLKNGRGKEDIDKAAHEYGLMIDKYREMDKKITSLARQKYEDKKARIEKLKEELRPVGASFINNLVSSSKVTQEQAESWASNQLISKSAITKLRKSGYKEADIRRDMAEFYRISGGKLRHISIETNGRRRASASGIGDIDGTVISPGSHFNKSILWHEMAHHLEADPAAKTAANGFLVKRRKDAKVYSLRSLTGNKGYRSDEGAYKDDFINPYIGKSYSDRTTEVWAMGIQYLSNPSDAAMMLAKDPEMAALMAGYIRSDLTPGMKALQAAQDGAKKKLESKRNDEEAAYQKAVKDLSEDVEFANDGWYESLSDVDKELLDRYVFDRNSKAEFIGSWRSYRVFHGKFKSRKTRRVSKGYTVLLADDPGSIKTSGAERRIPVNGVFHVGVDELKSVMKIAMDSDEFNGDIYRASYMVFTQGSISQNHVVHYASKILGGAS